MATTAPAHSDTAGRESGFKPSPLLQLLKEVPRHSDPSYQQQKQTRGFAEGAQRKPLDQPISRFATSKLAGRLSAVGTREDKFSENGTLSMRRANSRVIGGQPSKAETEEIGHGALAFEPRERLRGRIATPVSSTSSSRTTKLSKRTAVAGSIPAVAISSQQQPIHLPTIKRPSLANELRRRVLLNTSTALREHEKRQRIQEPRIRSPARASSQAGTTRAARVVLIREKGKVSTGGIENGDLPRLVKGIGHREGETVVHQRVREALKKQAKLGTAADNIGTKDDNQFSARRQLQQESSNPSQGSQPSTSTTTNLNDTHTTGSATRNLRRHFTHQKMSHKKEVLERAFGWDSQFIDDMGDIDEQIGRYAAAITERNQEETAPVPIGASVSSSDFVGAVKVAGSIGSKTSSGVLPARGSEWVDEEEGADADTVMLGNGAVRRGRSDQFQLDQNRIPATPLPKTRRRLRRSDAPRASTTPRNTTTQSLAPASHPVIAKRSLQRFNRVEDWLDHQRDSEKSSSNTPNDISMQTVQPITPRSITPRPSYKAKTHQNTPSAALFERRYPLNLTHIPYLKHNLKSNGRKGITRAGGVVTISPPTDSDQLGYIHLDLRGKRYVYIVIPGSGSGSVDTGKYTMVIVHPRRRKNKPEDTTVLETKDWTKGTSHEEVYALSELPAKHLSIVKFASKFVGIVRRGTVVVRIEGLNPGASTRSGGGAAIEAMAKQTAVSNSRWEWYRAEIYADGRFEFTVIPRGGVLGSSVEHENALKDGTIMLVGGVVKIVFTTTLASTSSSMVNGENGDDAVIPRFIGGHGSKGVGNGKLRKVHVEITRTLSASPSSSLEKPTSVVWNGLVELGPGSAPDSAVIVDKRVGNDTVKGEAKRKGACAGFAAEVDWARRMWIDCRRVADKKR